MTLLPSVPVRRLAGAVVLAVASAACGGRPAAPTRVAPVSGKAFVSLSSAVVRSEPGPGRPLATLSRDTELTLKETRDGFVRVAWGSTSEGWLPAGVFETFEARAARETRAASVADFPVVPARVVEPGPVLLAPDYGAARWGEVEDGDVVNVVLTDHDFYGVRLAKAPLAFVAARSVRLLPSTSPGRVPGAAARPSGETPPGAPDSPASGVLRETAAVAEASDPPARPGPGEPLASLPAGSSPPALVERIDPVYPEVARRAGIAGDVVLRIVVEADGAIGRVEVEKGAPLGLTEAASTAVKRWRYLPARVGGRPVAVWKVVRVKFSMGAPVPASGEEPNL